MIFVVVFFLNASGNFVLGVVLSGLLGPTEFGRFAMVALGASTLATALFDWLRLASVRFSASDEDRQVTAASLEASYIAMIAAAAAIMAGFIAFGFAGSLGVPLVTLGALMATAYARHDYCAALMRARSKGRGYAVLALIRHCLTFTVVVWVAATTRAAAPVVAALTGACFVAVVALGPTMRTPGARLALADSRRVGQFVVYAKPIVASAVLYLLINFVDRQLAFERFGAADTGKLSLAVDLGLRVFLAANFLTETLLFQHAVQRENEEGRAAAEKQIAVNVVLSFALLAPLTVGYMVMAPTFEALFVPAAYRGDYAGLSLSLAPGFFAYCALTSMCNPIFQLAGKTWPLTLAALSALAANVVLTRLAPFALDIDGLAKAYAMSLGVGLAVAAALAMRLKPVPPSLRDLLAIAAATAVMGLVIRPLNAIHPSVLAAALSVLIGGGIIAATMLALDIGGVRRLVPVRLRPPAVLPAIERRKG